MHAAPSLRILHVTPYSADAWAYGGIARLAGTMTAGLARLGHQVTVCTTDVCDGHTRLGTDGERPRRRAWPPQATDSGVTLRVFPNLSNRLAYHYQAFAPMGFAHYMREHAGDFDVAHLHACRNLPGAIAAKYLREHMVPYVLAPNGTAPRIERRKLLKRGFDALYGRPMASGATRVLAVSTTERQQLEQLGFDPATIRLIPNPLDLAEFDQPLARGRFRREYGIDGPIVLFLGKVTPRKRLDVVVRAFARLEGRGQTLVIAGNDMGGLDEATALARELGVADRVRVVGLLRGRERLVALADADAVVYPSEHEIFGLVPLEALLCGTPVVVGGDSGCAEVIRSTGGGEIVAVGDVEALAAAVRRMLRAREWWRYVVPRAAAVVRARYGGATICAELETMYGEMVA
jgi:glycosyltransferase involved in cell wall biosynthesis